MDGRTCLQNVDPSMALDNNHRNVLRSSTLRPAANGSNCLTTRRPHDLFKLANHFEEKVRSTRPRDLASSKTRAVGLVGFARARSLPREVVSLRAAPQAQGTNPPKGRPRKPRHSTRLRGAPGRRPFNIAPPPPTHPRRVGARRAKTRAAGATGCGPRGPFCPLRIPSRSPTEGRQSAADCADFQASPLSSISGGGRRSRPERSFPGRPFP